MSRIVPLLYGAVAYLGFLGVSLYAVGFIGGFITPTSLDGPPTGPPGVALTIDCALLAAFALQHSVMARPAFKRWWTRIVPESAERSTYVLLSCLALMALFILWQPVGGLVWKVNSPNTRALLYGAIALGWTVLLASTFLLNHFDLLGLRQVWLQLKHKPYQSLSFRTPTLCRYVRHPLYVGWLLTFWAALTVAHLVFALSSCVYILIAIRLEECDLIAVHPQYQDYRRRVPMLLPLSNGKSRASQASCAPRQVPARQTRRSPV